VSSRILLNFIFLEYNACFGWQGAAVADDDRAECTNDQSRPEGSSTEPSSADVSKEINTETPENAIENSEEQARGNGSALDKTDENHEAEIGADNAAKATPSDTDRKPKRLAGRLGQKNESEDLDEGNAPGDTQRRSDAFKVQCGHRYFPSDVNGPLIFTPISQREPKKAMEPYRVPTSGRFYLHDDRTADKPADEDEDEEQDESVRDGTQAVPASRRKSGAQEGADRWKHDRYDQAREATPFAFEGRHAHPASFLSVIVYRHGKLV
jgi:hypothetical protein